MELPTNIKYELLLIFGGISPLIFLFWLYIFHEEKFNILLNNDVFFIGIILTISTGVFLLLIGFYQLTNEYSRKQDISIRNYRIDRYETDKKLKLLPKEYL